MVKLESSSRSQIRARSCQCMTTMIRKTKEAYQKKKQKKKEEVARDHHSACRFFTFDLSFLQERKS